jgi:hypothetical protein
MPGTPDHWNKASITVYLIKNGEIIPEKRRMEVPDKRP